MGLFSTEQSIEQMEETINKCVGENVREGAIFINFKLQKKLIKEQNEYNRKQLFWSRFLTVGTWGLVLVTLLLVKFN